MLKKAQVIMLPTKNKSIKGDLVIGGSKLLGIHISNVEPSYHNSQHLYIISDDEIKKGDYIYHLDVCDITKAECDGNVLSKSFKKVIATTDTSLLNTIYTPHISGEISKRMRDLFKLPQPSQQFIEKYIESYNKGEVITDVLVEYFNNSDYNPSILDDIRLKINPKDHTITIKKLKDSWNREEVSNLIKLFANNYQYASNDIGYNKWIEENL